MACGHVTGSHCSANPDRCLIVQLSTHCAHNFIFERHIYLAQLPIVRLAVRLEIDENIFLSPALSVPY